MRLCVIGTGYVGLVAGTCFADGGHDVECVDVDAHKIENLRKGILPIYEPGLEEILKYNQKEGRLSFSTDIAKAITHAKVIFIAVGTPQKSDGSADLKYVLAACKSIGTAMNEYKIVVNKSTVPVGTAELVRAEIQKFTQKSFDVASNPEFLKEGSAISDFMKPDRIIIGVDNDKVATVLHEIYQPFNRTRPRLMVMGIRSAEMTKYASNAMLATKISFINEVANFCSMVGADINEVREGMGADSRIGYNFLFPGVGYGGSCFPKDVNALIDAGKASGYDFKILRAVDEVNALQKKVFLPVIRDYFNTNLAGKKIAIWGLSFKPKTDDMREAPSLEIIKGLLDGGAQVSVYDPVAQEEAKALLQKSVQFCTRSYDALKDADALIVVTEWNEFRRPDFELMKLNMKKPVVFDGRNIYDPQLMKKYGFTYYCIGRQAV